MFQFGEWAAESIKQALLIRYVHHIEELYLMLRIIFIYYHRDVEKA
ncbi:hypothetical protein J2Z81_001939 [Virgibacillus campisalis]|uniref:Uncharacterized protein n=1 Tax=Virgibacillus alimentarius TaxID=698769 RepID=A0ABS4S907_9BACI|nr:hypothetical protein [Virgibacillus alimentarius]